MLNDYGINLIFLYMKRITIQLSMASLLFSLASCGANMKPEHPQAFDSYKSRRMPKENTMAASGDYLKEQEEQKKIVAYKGGLFNQRNPKMEDKKDYPTSSEEPFMRRLLGRMGFNTESSSTQSANTNSSGFNTRIPVQQPNKAYNTPLPQVRQQENYVYQSPTISTQSTTTPMSSDSNMNYLQRPDANMPQGSAYTYTYYDIADEVIPASPVHDIEMSKLTAPIQLAAAPKAGEPMIPASAPLVDVPPTPTIDDMRNSAMSSPLQPELQEYNDGPRRSPPRPPRASPKPRPHGFAPRHRGPYPDDYSEPYDKGGDNPGESSTSSNNNRDIVVNDPSAKVYYKNGKPVVTGVMGN